MQRWIAILAVGAAVLGPRPLDAQDGLSVRVTPRVGLMTPADWFYVEYPHFGLDPVEWTEAAILRAPVVGLAVELEPGGSGLWIRGEVTRTVDAIVSMTHALLRETNGFEPPRVERTPYRVATTVTMATVDLALPTRFTLGPIQPYVAAGVGGKRYAFDTGPFGELSDNVILPESGVVPMANVGGGAVIRVLGLSLDVQARDALSVYWDAVQHDVTFFAGLTWRVY